MPYFTYCCARCGKEIHKALNEGLKMFNTLETKNNKQIKNQVVHQHLLQKKTKDLYKIIDDEKRKVLRIMYRDEEGKRKEILKRYKRRPKDEVHEEMNEERNKLLNKLNTFEMDNEIEEIYKEKPQIIQQLNKPSDDLNSKKYNKIVIEFDL